MTIQEDIDGQLVRLQTYRTTLQIYLQQMAMLGSAYAPPALSHGISECRHNIEIIKSALRDRGLTTEDHPDDSKELVRESTVPSSSRTKQKSIATKRKNPILSLLDQGINLPSFGDIFVSKVIDMDETLVLVEIPGLDPEVIPGVIRAENIGGKKYRIGYSARVEVIAVKQTKTGKIAVELTPVFAGR